LYHEQFDAPNRVFAVDTSTGAVAGSTAYYIFQGDGEVDPTGAYYYHCDDDSSNAHITKYALANDAFTTVTASNVHRYGSRNLVQSGDGSRLFWMGHMFDAPLNDLAALPGEVYATTLHGDLAFGSGQVFNTHTGASIYALPFSTTISAVSGDQRKVFLYDPAGALTIIPMSQIAVIPGPGLVPTPADGSTVQLPLRSL